MSGIEILLILFMCILNTLVHNTPCYARTDLSGSEQRNELDLQVHREIVATTSEHDIHTICRVLYPSRELSGDAVLCY